MMQKRFFRKSILVHAIVGGALGLALLPHSTTGYAAHPALSLLGIAAFALLTPTLGMMIEARVK